jgi:hypothetical protein
VLDDKTFLFLRLLDAQTQVDSETAKAALTTLGTKAVKRI